MAREVNMLKVLVGLPTRLLVRVVFGTHGHPRWRSPKGIEDFLEQVELPEGARQGLRAS